MSFLPGIAPVGNDIYCLKHILLLLVYLYNYLKTMI